MRITVVDPPAYTPPYDHALCSALARRGMEVELATSRFRHATPPAPERYRRSESFYRLANGSAAAKALQHPIDMLRLASSARRAGSEVVHFQWLPIPELDLRLIQRFRGPLLMTAHDVLPREAGVRRRRVAAKLLREVDAVVTHSEQGRVRLLEEADVPEENVSVIPHGAFDYLTCQSEEAPMDRAAGELEGRKVVLFFGLLRPYKGLEVLLEAFAAAPEEAVLLVVGKPRMPLEPLRRRACELGLEERVRFIPRFVADSEIPAYFRRADLVALPYRETDQSGVLATALAFGCPLVASAVGGFVELGEREGAARLVPPGDVAALGDAIVELLADGDARARLADAARRAAAGPYSWDRVAGLTIDLYRSLLERAKGGSS